MTPDLTNQVTAGLLILTLASVLLIALVLTLFAVSYLKRSRGVIRKIATRTPSAMSARYHSLIIERPSRWLAVRSTSIEAVADALELYNASPCSWGEGMSRLNEHALFVAPPVKGWIVVVGQAVPDPADDVDECFRFVTRLSRALGHVQYFSANRPLNHHAWVRANDGKVLRAYAWAGETLWNQGNLTPVEQELDMRCFDYGEGPESFDPTGVDVRLSNADKIGSLAARWSLDPMTVDPSMLPAEQGLAGNLIPSRLS